MRNRAGRLALAGLLVAMIAGACNTVDKEGEFIPRADAICARANSGLEAAALNAGDNPRAVARLFSTSAGIVQQVVDEIRDLDAPDEDEDLLEEYLEANEDAAEAFEEAAEGAEAEDNGVLLAAIADAEAALNAAGKAANEYGFEDCGTRPEGGSESAEE